MVTIICDNKVLVVGIGEKGLYKLVNLKTRKAQTIVIVENTDVL
jgi:siroheme synthase (precorrin-2 oxidase/ferrochelatase)